MHNHISFGVVHCGVIQCNDYTSVSQIHGEIRSEPRGLCGITPGFAPLPNKHNHYRIRPAMFLSLAANETLPVELLPLLCFFVDYGYWFPKQDALKKINCAVGAEDPQPLIL